MKTSLKLFLAGLVLLTQGFGQEPKQALAKASTAATKNETIVSGAAPQAVGPVVQPKALPPLNPPLGDIARQARAAHAAAPKAQMVVETDTAKQKEDKSQTTAATSNQE
jgi:hypothetical protein